MSGRVLGVDLGIKRTGLALSDELGISVEPLPTLTPGSRAQDVAFLVALCAERGVDDVVIGLPLLASGDDGPMTKRARGFAAALDAALRAGGAATRVHLVDETGSSKEAARRLIESGVRKSRRKASLDAEAARVLVQEFLATRDLRARQSQE